MDSLFTSESVSRGHPDKIADQISDAILDACLSEDPFARVACETMVTPNLVHVGGEISYQGNPIPFEDIIRHTITDIGYNDPNSGFSSESCKILNSIIEQSPDIAQSVIKEKHNDKKLGAGDQGMMFGFACKETKELMPLPITLAHQILRKLELPETKTLFPYLMPDAKSQVTIHYDEKGLPKHIDTIVLSTQHKKDISQQTIQSDMRVFLEELLPKHLLDEKTRFFINPSGRFVIGGPCSDSGLTGRKIIVDTYGGMGRHGGGAFSGKDPSKVDRSGAYAGRWIAKHIVASGLASKCEVQLAYAIGVCEPVSLKVDTFGTSSIPEALIAEAVLKTFDLSPGGIIQTLNLRQPIYFKTSHGGHFGREEDSFSWEKTPFIQDLLAALP